MRVFVGAALLHFLIERAAVRERDFDGAVGLVRLLEDNLAMPFGDIGGVVTREIALVLGADKREEVAVGDFIAGGGV